jgi:transcriptional regulator with XRE-family HTH domain
MVKLKTESLTAIGKIIHDTGLSLNYVIEKSGITRNRLSALRTSRTTILSFQEARQLAPVLRMTLDELAASLDATAAEEKNR